MTEDIHFPRMGTDIDPANIDTMIAAENDSGKRILLIVLSNLNSNLLANTQTIEIVRKDLKALNTSFETHTTRDEALLNTGKGAWKILAAILGLAQIGISFGMVALLDKISSMDHNIVMLQMDHIRHEGVHSSPQYTK